MLICYINNLQNKENSNLGIKNCNAIDFYYFAIQSAATSFASGEVGVGLMVWFNVIVLLIMSPTIKKIFDDYMAQRKAGIENLSLILRN